MNYLKQSTAAVIPFGPGLLPADGVTLVTTLVSAMDNGTTGIFLSKNGGAAAIRHATVTATTYDAYGYYLVTLDTTDTNTLGRLRVSYAAAATTVPIWDDYTVLPANIFDSFISGSDLFDVSTTQLAGQTVTAAAGVTFPTSVSSPTNITAGTITTVTNLTNAPTAGDLTATMKTSVTTAATAATPVAASVTGAVGSVTGNVGGNVTGTVGSVVGAVGSVTGAVGSVTGNVGGNVTGSVGSVVAGVTLTASQIFIKKNTQITLTFPMTDSTTHAPATGLTVTARRSIDGAAVGNCANSVTELSLGLYSLVLAAGDVNGAMISLIFTATAADTRFIGLVTQA